MGRGTEGVVAESSGAAPTVSRPGPPVDTPLLDIKELTVCYRSGREDVLAVEGVSLALRPGELVGLAGESGSGKSTLAYAACRLLRPPAVITGGSVVYSGRRSPAAVDVLRATGPQLRALRWREIAIVFQSAMSALNPVLRVQDQLVDVITRHLGLGRRAALEKSVELLGLVAIDERRLRSYPHQLSGGMRQRVMIAMALATDPELVIMDEPTTALDVVVQREILTQIKALRRRLGFAVLLITHDLSLLLELADRIVVMYAGRVVESAPTAEVRGRPAHPYTAGLLSSFPTLHGPKRLLKGIPGAPPEPRVGEVGCRFRPRCPLAEGPCATQDVRLEEVAPDHLSACPVQARAGGDATRSTR